MQERFDVPDVSCQHCVSAIEGALKDVRGIESARVELDEKAVHVVYDPTAVERDQIVSAIEEEGYPVSA